MVGMALSSSDVAATGSASSGSNEKEQSQQVRCGDERNDQTGENQVARNRQTKTKFAEDLQVLLAPGPGNFPSF
eukprot:m.582163 g.582163  ORF g.582163 m.582163 type:complete len:74 (-) comp57941_c0_seq37:762-983(-)